MPQTTNKVGRPTRYNQKIASKICAQLSQGISLRSVCEDPTMPARATIFNWFYAHPDFVDQYTRAKQESADAMAEDVMDIADDGSNDWMEKHYGNDDDSTWVVNGEALQRSRLRVETRKWLMAKMKPKKYGDKLDMTTNGKDLPSPILAGVTSKDKES